MGRKKSFYNRKSRKRSWYTFLLPSLLVVLMLTVLTIRFFGNRPEGTIKVSDPKNGVTLQAEKGVANTDSTSLFKDADTTLTFYVDSWSLLNIDKRTLTVTPINKSAKAEIELNPITEEDISLLLKNSPESLKVILSRFYSTSSKIACDTKGCTDNGKEIDLNSAILNPEKIPGLGLQYSAYMPNMPLLYLGKLRVPHYINSFNASVGDSSPAQLYISQEDKSLQIEPVASLPTNGYNSQHFYLSSSFGVTFTPSVGWSATKPFKYQFNLFSKSDSIMLSKNYIPFLGGLGNKKDALYARTMDNSLLTYITSPITGCGYEVICAPGTLSNSINIDSYSNVEVCDSSNIKGSMQMYRGTYQVEFKKPTFSAGILNYDPNSLPNNNRDSILSIKGDPKPITGSFKVYFSYNLSRDSLEVKYLSGNRSLSQLTDDTSIDATIKASNSLYRAC